MNTKNVKACAVCGKDFPCIPSTYGIQRHCSAPCAARANLKDGVAIPSVHPKPCAQCGHDFLNRRCTPSRKFCSASCMGAHYSTIARSKGDRPKTTGMFWSRVDKFGPAGIHSQTGVDLGPCWMWTGRVNKAGYGVCGGMIACRRWHDLVHRVTYRHRTGALPEKPLELDHLCRVRACCNPEHLEAVTRLENVARGDGPRLARIRMLRLDACSKGHPHSEKNTYVYTSKGGTQHRRCRPCHVIRQRAFLARQ